MSFNKILIFIFLVGSVWYVTDWIYDKWQSAEKKPFWRGGEIVLVCKKPYFPPVNCYQLYVTLSRDLKEATINFPNGEMVRVKDIHCWKGGSGFVRSPDYVFCRSLDKTGQQWDFIPAWMNLDMQSSGPESMDKALGRNQ